MEQKEHSLFKPGLIALAFAILSGCSSPKKEEPINTSTFVVDTASVPLDTISSNEKLLKLDNGIYYVNNHAYSGYIRLLNPNGTTNSIGGVLNGMLHGTSISFYENGKRKDIRMYRANKSVGKQIGYWENGNQKFEFYYLEDKREGSSKQWYISGKPYAFLNFKDDREDGMQRAWRENGKPYINYEVKDGHRYGLQKSNLCYTLEKEKFK